MKLILSVLFSLLVVVAFTQEINSEWSSFLDKSEKEVPVKIFPNVDSGYTLIKRIPGIKNAISINILDSNNVLVASNKVEVQADKILKIELVNGKITLFSVLHNVEKAEDELSAYTLNASGELSGTTKIASLKSNGGYLAIYKVAVSSDGTKVGVLCEKPFMKEKKEELIIKILDKDLQPLLSKDFSYNIPSMKRRFNVPLINEKGSLYIIKRTRVKMSNKYFLTLIKESGVEEHHDLKLRNMRIADVAGRFTKDGELIVSGFYAGYSGFNFEGAFSIKYNESTLPVYRKEFLLPENLITGLKSKKEISKFGNGLDKFHVKKIIVTDNGNSYLVAEHLLVNKTEKETIETRKGLAVIKFSNKGDFLWGAPIVSNQIDNKNKGYWSSSITVGFDKNLFVLYSPVGEGLKKPEEVYGDNALIGTKICKVDVNGVVVSEPLVDLFADLPEGVTLNAKTYYLTDNRELVIVAENETRNKCYLGKLTFPKKK